MYMPFTLIIFIIGVLFGLRYFIVSEDIP
jgi:hypothetical protein